MTWPQRGWWNTFCTEHDDLSKYIIDSVTEFEKTTRHELIRDAVRDIFCEQCLDDRTYPEEKIRAITIHKTIQIPIITDSGKVTVGDRASFLYQYLQYETVLQLVDKTLSKMLPETVEIPDESSWKWTIHRTIQGNVVEIKFIGSPL